MTELSEPGHCGLDSVYAGMVVLAQIQAPVLEVNVRAALGTGGMSQ